MSSHKRPKFESYLHKKSIGFWAWGKRSKNRHRIDFLGSNLIVSMYRKKKNKKKSPIVSIGNLIWKELIKLWKINYILFNTKKKIVVLHFKSNHL